MSTCLGEWPGSIERESGVFFAGDDGDKLVFGDDDLPLFEVILGGGFAVEHGSGESTCGEASPVPQQSSLSGSSARNRTRAATHTRRLLLIVVVPCCPSVHQTAVVLRKERIEMQRRRCSGGMNSASTSRRSRAARALRRTILDMPGEDRCGRRIIPLDRRLRLPEAEQAIRTQFADQQIVAGASNTGDPAPARSWKGRHACRRVKPGVEALACSNRRGHAGRTQGRAWPDPVACRRQHGRCPWRMAGAAMSGSGPLV